MAGNSHVRTAKRTVRTTAAVAKSRTPAKSLTTDPSEALHALALKQDAALKRVTSVMQAQRQKIAELQAENAALKVEVEALRKNQVSRTAE